MTAVAERRVNTVDVEIVVPVFNEEADLGPSVLRLHTFLQDSFPFRTLITIADNASTDGTLAARHRAGQLAHRRARRASRRQGPRARAAAGLGTQRRARSSPTWTSTCPPTWTRCCRSSRR